MVMPTKPDKLLKDEKSINYIMAEAISWASIAFSISCLFVIPPVGGILIDVALRVPFPIFGLIGTMLGFVIGLMSLIRLSKNKLKM
jgi:hypothetical protein